MTADSMRAQTLHFWVVYNRPIDFPDLVVARKWRVSPTGLCFATVEHRNFESIAGAVRYFDLLGLHWIPRSPADDPVIEGCWL